MAAPKVLANPALQSVNPADLVFTEATPAQRHLAWELNGVSWATPMSIQDYIKREMHLSSQELSKDGGCQYWVLHLKDNPDNIIASCESTKKHILLRRPGSDVPVEEALAYSIASVYTNPSYRRQGMASLMLRLLQQEMDKHSECSVLYSDIGKQYYAQLGWAVFPAEQATISVMEADKFQRAHANLTTPLTKEDLRQLCDADVSSLKSRFDQLGNDGKIHVAFLPSYAQVSWQLAREEFMSGVIHGKEPQHKGAATAEARSWIVWDHDWREQKLKIQRIAFPGSMSTEQKAADTLVLLEAAIEEALAWGLQKVLVWNPDQSTITGIKGLSNAHEAVIKVVFDERKDGSIPSLRLKDGADPREVVWEDNQYYAWC